jgi:hypothetical protein
MRNSYRMLFTIPEKKSLLVRPGYRREERVKINLEGMEFESMVWIELAQAGITYCVLVSTTSERTNNFFTNRRPSAYQEIVCSME